MTNVPATLSRVRPWRLEVLVVAMLIALLTPAGGASGQISPGKLARAHKSLEGAAQCVQCHALSRAPMATSCLSCHKDVKAMIDTKRGYHARLSPNERQSCASCHPDHAGEDFSMIAWPGAGKTRFDHRQAGWALEGKHIEAKCEDCHTSKYATAPVAALSKRKSGTPWIGLETSCNSCHKSDDIHEGALKGGCDQCHTAKDWAPAPKFDHDDARYRLTGKHADAKCDACHKSSRLALKLSNTGEKIALYRPLAYAKCNDCHADPHKGRLKGSCSSCHETTNWDAIDRRDFNHAATRYPLTGKHARVACASCHGKNNETPTPAFATCAGCHADVHRGEAGRDRDCAACHRVAAFTPAAFSVADHARTAYPLQGKHTSTSCSACHTTAPATAATRAFVRLKMPATTCADCHEDAHAGQAAVRSAVGGCTNCHTVEGFKPSTITVAAHARFRYALDGAHANATCAACHASDRRGLPLLLGQTGRAKFAFAVGDTTCGTCHVDPHAGRYLSGGVRAALGCRACHSAATFRPSTVTVDAHQQLGYALEGAHRAVACAECHAELKAPGGRGSLKLGASGTPPIPFKQARNATCTGCHAESHGTQFARRKDRGACESCHTVARFAGAEKFDHEKQTRFKLAGAHATVACAKCHVVLPTLPETVPVSARRLYAGVSMACESCHAAPPVRTR